VNFLERGIASIIHHPSTNYYSNQEAAKKATISIYQLSNLVDWFGPLKGSDSSQPMVLHLRDMLLKDWFFGPIEKSQSDKLVKRFKDQNLFLLRLNTGTSIPIDKSPFIITVEQNCKEGSTHIRVYPNGAYGKWICKLPTGEKVKGDTVQKLIDNLRGEKYLTKAVGETPFRSLSHQNENHGSYAGDDVDGLDDL